MRDYLFIFIFSMNMSFFKTCTCIQKSTHYTDLCFSSSQLYTAGSFLGINDVNLVQISGKRSICISEIKHLLLLIVFGVDDILQGELFDI